MSRRWNQILLCSISQKNRSQALPWMFLLFLTHCSKLDDRFAAGPVQTKVLDINQVQNEKKVFYEMAPRELQSIQNLKQLTGKYFGFNKGGNLKIKEIDGSIIVPSSFSGGGSPDVRYTFQDNIAVARDYNSFVLMSSFFQFEKIYSNLAKVTGVTADTFLSEFGYINILVEPSISIETNGTKATSVTKLNAAYVTGQKQFVLFKRSAIEGIPLATNPQVLSHEFGHALFEYAFYKQKAVNCETPQSDKELAERLTNRNFAGRFETEYAIRGLNEGFADFMSYAFVGSTDILRGSLDIGSLADQRDFGNKRFIFEELSVTNKEILDEICSGQFYCIGTLFAKSLLSTMKDLKYTADSVEKRGEFAKQVFTALKDTKAAMLELDVTAFPNPPDFVAECKEAEKDSNGIFTSPSTMLYHGKITGAFLGAFIKSSPQENRSSLCKYFKEHFGVTGFPTAARSNCPAT